MLAITNPRPAIRGVILGALMMLIGGGGYSSRSEAGEPIKLILDTDLGDDCDDAGSMAMMHALADQGKLEILAVMISNRTKYAPACADAINTYFQRPDIPIGTVKNSTSKQDLDKYATYIAENYPHDTGPADTVPGAVTLYRKILAQQPDTSVVIVTVGPATNISQLLDSGPDEFSVLSGVELVEKKVDFYAAGGNGRGNLPEGQVGWNYAFDLRSAQNELLKFPASIPMVFAGGSGMKVMTGAGYERKPENHIIRKCYEKLHKRTTDLSRNSWDQLRLWYATLDRSNFETSPPGEITLSKDSLKYHAVPNRNRSYAYVRDIRLAAEQIEALMMHEPGVTR